MPWLEWHNRDDDLKATAKTPYRLLQPIQSLSYGDEDAPNMLIQGDNLEALKALLPYYAGQVKCIFIDPPYNTKSAFEHYDDNLEHAQWLSMMYPRMVLLRELLAEDGSIWITLDDNEAHYFKVMCDEIFGRQSFVATVCWESRYSRSSDTSLSLSHNFLFVYAKNAEKWKSVRNKLPRSQAQAAQYKNPDNDPRGPWRAIPFDAPEVRANLEYPIITPTGKVRKPPQGRHWARTEEQWLQLVDAGLAYFGKSGDGAPSFKQFLSEAPEIVPNTWWEHEDAGHTDEAQKEGKLLFGTSTFATPKPERLMKRIIHIASQPGDLILDSFLGSGTTSAVAHKMRRRWIGIEMGEHARTYCQPRLVKVIDGEQGGVSKALDWQGGGGFRFYQLGPKVFDDKGRINPEIKFEHLAAHIWFAETGTARSTRAMKSPLLGVHNGTAYYLLYNGILGDKTLSGGNMLTMKVLAGLPKHDGPMVIYGEGTNMTNDRLRSLGIKFKKTPNDIRAR